MAVHQVLAEYLFESPAGVVYRADHKFPTLADAANATVLSFCHLQFDSLLPHDFTVQNSHLQVLLRGQQILETLTLRMAPIGTQDRVHALDITYWEMHALRSLHVYNCFPKNLGDILNGTGNEFSNLTSLTLGRVDGLQPQITVPSFFRAVKTWRSLEHLDIEHYSQLMHDPHELPADSDFPYLPKLKTLSLTDAPAWISKVLTYSSTPNLTQLHLRTAITINIANPGAVATVLTSWVPNGNILQGTVVSTLLARVSKVEVRMPENEHQPMQILGLADKSSRLLTLEMDVSRPLGMDDTAWKALHARWSQSSESLGQIITGLPRLFSTEDIRVSSLDVSGDLDGVVADHWISSLRHFPGLMELKVDARDRHGVSELFIALTGSDAEGLDLVCPNLGDLRVERARYSKAFLMQIADSLWIRREAVLAHTQLNLLSSCDDYMRDFVDGENPMNNTRLGDVICNGAVGSFNLRISDWRNCILYACSV